jgi:hypothetical protein
MKTVLASQAVLVGASHHSPSLGAYAVAYIVLAVVVAVTVVGVASIFSPRWRRIAPRAIAFLLGGLVAVYSVGRGIAEFWTVNYSDPASYAHSWAAPASPECSPYTADPVRPS